MSDVTDIIQQIASKVGTTAEAAWPIYCRYIAAEGYTGILVSVALGVGAVLLGRFIAGRIKMCDAARDSWDRMDSLGYMIFGGIGLAGLMLACLVTLAESVPKVISPEGAAIQSVVTRVAK